MFTEKRKKKVVQLLGMLGSFHDGEVLNAARLAHKEMINGNMRWEDLFNGHAPADLWGANPAEREEGREEGYKEGFEAGLNKSDVLHEAELEQEYKRGFDAGVKSAKAKKVKMPLDDPAWKDFARMIYDEHEAYLTAWERDFVISFATGVRFVPTERQYAIFCRLAKKLRIALPAAYPHVESDDSGPAQNGQG